MNQLKRLTSISLLILACTLSINAGIIECPAPTPPPPRSQAAESGDIWIHKTTQSHGPMNLSMAEVALNLLREARLIF